MKNFVFLLFKKHTQKIVQFFYDMKKKKNKKKI